MSAEIIQFPQSTPVPGKLSDHEIGFQWGVFDGNIERWRSVLAQSVVRCLVDDRIHEVRFNDSDVQSVFALHYCMRHGKLIKTECHVWQSGVDPRNRLNPRVVTAARRELRHD